MILRVVAVALVLAAPVAARAQLMSHANNTPFGSAVVPGCGGTPSEASEAGFSNCAMFIDFSTAGAVSSNFDCTDTDPTKLFHWGGVGVSGASIGGAARCAAALTQVSDPITGQTVLQAKWLTSYGIGYANDVISATWLDTTHYKDVPPNFYAQVTLRQDASSITSGANGQTGGPNELYSTANRFSSGTANPSPLKGVENDWGELWGGTTAAYIADAAALNWNAGSPGGGFVWGALAAPPTVTAYTTYGYRVTSNGSSSAIACAWINHALQKCQTFGGAFTSQMYLDRQILQFIVGNQQTGFPTSKNQTLYVSSFGAWTCTAGYPVAATVAPTVGTSCNGSLMTGTLPGDTYWH